MLELEDLRATLDPGDREVEGGRLDNSVLLDSEDGRGRLECELDKELATLGNKLLEDF